MEIREGFYALYYTGQFGSGVILICLKNEKIVGIDAVGGKVHGKYSVADAGVQADMVFEFAAGSLVTGQSLPHAMSVPSKVLLGADFFQGKIAKLDIGTGPVNVRAEFLSDPI
jgi:hypothetical protein